VLSNSGGKAQKVGGAWPDTPRRCCDCFPTCALLVMTWVPARSADELMSLLLARGVTTEVPVDPASAWRLPRAAYVAWFQGQSPLSSNRARGMGSHLPPADPCAAVLARRQASERMPLLALHEPHSDGDGYLFTCRV